MTLSCRRCPKLIDELVHMKMKMREMGDAYRMQQEIEQTHSLNCDLMAKVLHYTQENEKLRLELIQCRMRLGEVARPTGAQH